MQTTGLDDAQQDVVVIPCAGVSEAEVSEVSFPAPAYHEAYRIDDHTPSQVDMFQSRSTV